ncbi:hypothetical protein LzC2_41650 [Planctomycetes bacterium LzC2]|uniref:Uncharacterized protein n=1 Tax=Alienimonas chondri TaxID=2681879 RepID=A0ABX1VK02_9PLAN|nr:hypothetical protein [Alienimonas chondri]
MQQGDPHAGVAGGAGRGEPDGHIPDRRGLSARQSLFQRGPRGPAQPTIDRATLRGGEHAEQPAGLIHNCRGGAVVQSNDLALRFPEDEQQRIGRPIPIARLHRSGDGLQLSNPFGILREPGVDGVGFAVLTAVIVTTAASLDRGAYVLVGSFALLRDLVLFDDGVPEGSAELDLKLSPRSRRNAGQEAENRERGGSRRQHPRGSRPQRTEAWRTEAKRERHGSDLDGDRAGASKRCGGTV